MPEKVYMSKAIWVDITNAVREKSGSANRYVAGEVAQAIRALPTYSVEPLTAYQNGTYFPPEGCAYDSVNVDVSDSIIPRSLPDDGSTYIGYTVPEGTPEPVRTATICFFQSVQNGVELNWGDGTPPETFSGTGEKTVTHIYAETGREYIINIKLKEGDLYLGGGDTFTICGNTKAQATAACWNRTRVNWIKFGREISALKSHCCANFTHLQEVCFPEQLFISGNNQFTACNSLKKLRIPGRVTNLTSNFASYSYSLEEVWLPESLTTIGAYCFRNCSSLRDIIIPASVTFIGNYAFYSCSALAHVELPPNLVEIQAYAFYACPALLNISIPQSVTGIGAYAFYGCFSCTRVRFNSTTPPDIANANAFTGLPPSCIISVPVGALSAYTSAANYPDPNTYTYIEED